MSGVTLAQAQAKLDALMSASVSGALSVRFGDRQVTRFASYDDLIKAINYWERRVAELTRIAAGRSRHGYSLADFR